MTTPALRVLSLIPPMTQLNTPYPSTAYLTGFLRSRGVPAVQEDLALALVLRLFTPAGLDAVCGRAQALPEAERSASVHAFLDQFALYRSTITPVIAFLQGRDYVAPDDIAAVLPQTTAHRLVPVRDAGRGAVEQVRAMLDAVPLP